MAAANDAQMQQFANERLRPRAEQLRALFAAAADDVAAIPDVFDRAANGDPWADARASAPAHLLTSQDILVHNAVGVLLLKCIDGTATLQDVSDLHANWPVFQAACVRPEGS